MERYRPTALKKNRAYETYQLYAEVGWKVKLDAPAIFCESVRLTFKWLIDRFRDNEIPPDLMEYSGIDELTPEGLKSFHIDEGYIIDVAYIADESAWAIHLTEPDQGSQMCPALAGRTFETNFAFRIVGKKVEFATKTICSQPDDVEEMCEIFRPSVVKWLSDDLGLTHHWELQDTAHTSAEPFRKRIFKSKMPMVLFADVSDSVDVAGIAHKLLGFAHVFDFDANALNEWNKNAVEFGVDFDSRFFLRKNECLIIYPYKGARLPVRYYESEIRRRGGEDFKAMLLRDLTRCNLDLKGLAKGSVMFYGEARRQELKKQMESSAKMNDIPGMIRVQSERDAQYEADIESRDRQIRKLKQQLNDMKCKNFDDSSALDVSEADYSSKPRIPFLKLSESYRIVLLGGKDSRKYIQNLKKRNPNLVSIQGSDKSFDDSTIRNADFVFIYKDCMGHGTAYRAEDSLAQVPYAALRHHTNIDMMERAMANVLIRHFNV